MSKCKTCKIRRTQFCPILLCFSSTGSAFFRVFRRHGLTCIVGNY